jgi:hypothetical protein
MTSAETQSDDTKYHYKPRQPRIVDLATNSALDGWLTPSVSPSGGQPAIIEGVSSFAVVASVACR